MTAVNFRQKSKSCEHAGGQGPPASIVASLRPGSANMEANEKSSPTCRARPGPSAARNKGRPPAIRTAITSRERQVHAQTISASQHCVDQHRRMPANMTPRFVCAKIDGAETGCTTQSLGGLIEDRTQLSFDQVQ